MEDGIEAAKNLHALSQEKVKEEKENIDKKEKVDTGQEAGEKEVLTSLIITEDSNNPGWYNIIIPKDFKKSWHLTDPKTQEFLSSFQEDFQNNPGSPSIIKIINDKVSLIPTEFVGEDYEPIYGHISQNTLEKLYIKIISETEGIDLKKEEGKYILNVDKNYEINFKDKDEFVNFLTKYINLHEIDQKEKQPYLISHTQDKDFKIIIPKTEKPEEISDTSVNILCNIILYRN